MFLEIVPRSHEAKMSPKRDSLLGTLSVLIHTAFEQLALENEAGHLVIISGEVQELHRRFYAIREDLRHQFPILKELHFRIDGFFYSSDLEDALFILLVSGAITRKGTEIMVLLREDGVEMAQESKRVLDSDEKLSQDFRKLLDHLRLLIVHPSSMKPKLEMAGPVAL
jgi:hypothetical protein